MAEMNMRELAVGILQVQRDGPLTLLVPLAISA